MVEYLTVKNGCLYANREINVDDIPDIRGMILYYRGCGYKTVTIQNIIKTESNMTDLQIKNVISNHVKKVKMPFRPYTNDKKAWREYYGEKAMRNWGKTFNNNSEFTDNQPLISGDYRKFNGTTKAENQLLREIRIG